MGSQALQVSNEELLEVINFAQLKVVNNFHGLGVAC